MSNASEVVQKYAPLAARILLAQLFIISGIGKLASFAETQTFMAGMGLPLPRVLLLFTIALEVGGGVLLVFGWQARRVAAAFFGFTLLTTMIFHAFWSSSAAAVFGQLNNFMKNLAIMGGMLYVIVHGAGPLSLDSRRIAAEALPAAGVKRKTRK